MAARSPAHGRRPRVGYCLAAGWVMTAGPPRSGASAAAGLDVLVDVERVVRVVALLDPGEPVVVAAVGPLHPLLALVHHEVEVRAAGRGRVQLLPVIPGPLRDGGGVGRVRIDADDHAGPAAVTVGEGGRVGGHPAGGAVDGVQVHGGVAGGQQRPVLAVHLDGGVG